jgi:SET domain-containing protein
VLRKGRIVFVALCRIAPGEEITYDYGREYFDFFLKPSGCRCAACAARAKTRRSRRQR